jgi:hypothetical protein
MVEASDHVYVLRQTYACRMYLFHIPFHVPVIFFAGKSMRHAYVCRKTYT